MAARMRAVLVHRISPYEALLARHATHGQVVFFLQQRGLSVEPLQRAHLQQLDCIRTISNSIPSSWGYASVERSSLDRFDFTADDLIIVVGQDGLVPNVSKYLTGQPVLGFDPTFPDHKCSAQLMVKYSPIQAESLLFAFEYGVLLKTERRTMIHARLDDSQQLLALNEIFIGHRSHQSARYDIRYGEERELQSSSGLIIASGTGSSGWMSSLNGLSSNPIALPAPEEQRLTFRVREPWVSEQTSACISAGELGKFDQLEIVSKMESQGVIFGDGIEQDYLPFEWGQTVTLSVATQSLNLLTLPFDMKKKG